MPRRAAVSKSSDLIPIRIGHSPDPDDAFMWYPLSHQGRASAAYSPLIDTRPYRFIHVLEDIQSLNNRCEKGELEITALSIHQYPYVADRYALTSCGSSMGDHYGPMIVAPGSSKLRLKDLASPKLHLAIPGTRTTAFLTLRLLLRSLGRDDLRCTVVPFDQIIQRVAAGDFDAGLIIHEGQLTYRDSGLECLADLGAWWTDKTKLPLPLGGNAIRRDLGRAPSRRICRILYNSIRYALAHRKPAVKYAMQFGRGMKQNLTDKFVAMYVNKWTLDYGPTGRRAVRKLLSEAAQAQLIPNPGKIDFITPA